MVYIDDWGERSARTPQCPRRMQCGDRRHLNSLVDFESVTHSELGARRQF